MRKSIVLLLSFICFVYIANAQQCDKKYKMKTERVVTINADSSEGEEIPFTAEITISKDSIFITIAMPDGNTAEISGKHSAVVCKMNADYSNGSIEYKTDATMQSGGQSRDAKMIFNIEAKDGKFKVFGVPEGDQQEKICFYIKEKEEVK